MKTLKQLMEARRNPKQNPKSSAYEKLKKYAGNNDIFITYTAINKVGVNPQNDFNTPTAVYAYPLNQVWKYIDRAKDATKVPFAGDRKLIQVIKPKGRFIHDLSTKYSKAMYDKDMEILRKKYGNANTKVNTGREKYLKAFDTFYKKISWMEKSIKTLKKSNGDHKRYVDRTLTDITEIATGVKELLDAYPKNFQLGVKSDIRFMMNDIADWLYDIKQTIIVANQEDKLEDKDKVRVVMDTTIQSIGNAMVAYAKVSNEGEGANVEWSIDVGSSTARDQSWGGKMWNVTRLISNGHSEQGSKSSVAKWNKILREDLGYSGMADRSGKGIIHPAEPVQAVFFSTAGLNHIETIINKKHRYTVDIKTMDDFFFELNYTRGEKFDLEQIGFDIMNKKILPENRNSFYKILHKYMIDNAGKIAQAHNDASDIGAYLMYFGKFDKLSKIAQKNAFWSLTNEFGNPLHIFNRMGMNLKTKVLNKRFAEFVKIPKKEWKEVINYTYLEDIYNYSKDKGYTK